MRDRGDRQIQIGEYARQGILTLLVAFAQGCGREGAMNVAKILIDQCAAGAETASYAIELPPGSEIEARGSGLNGTIVTSEGDGDFRIDPPGSNQYRTVVVRNGEVFLSVSENREIKVSGTKGRRYADGSTATELEFELTCQAPTGN